MADTTAAPATTRARSVNPANPLALLHGWLAVLRAEAGEGTRWGVQGRRVDGAVWANEAGVGEGNARVRGRGRSYWIARRSGRAVVARRQGECGSPDHLVGMREGGLALLGLSLPCTCALPTISGGKPLREMAEESARHPTAWGEGEDGVRGGGIGEGEAGGEPR
jgi:hypothetical protein